MHFIDTEDCIGSYGHAYPPPMQAQSAPDLHLALSVVQILAGLATYPADTARNRMAMK
ncbi:hypothetical protein BGX26_005828, partial [Mortierella sp. AD094]